MWEFTLGITDADSRLSPGSSTTFNINFTLPPGIAAGGIRYGEVPALGETYEHGLEPNIPDTFTGPMGVVGLTVAARWVRLASELSV